MSLRKAIYIILGCIGLILGAVGVIVPMLPGISFSAIGSVRFCPRQRTSAQLVYQHAPVQKQS